MKKFIFIAVIVIIFGGMVAFAYLRPKQSQVPGAPRPQGQGPGGPRGQQEALVEAQEVKEDTIADMVSVTGTINARSEVEIYPKQSGEIVQLLVDVGDRVKQGQPLALIESKTFELQVKQAEADLASAKASYEKNSSTALVNFETSFKQAKTNLDRLSSVLKQTELDLQLQEKQAKAAVKKAEADLRVAQARLDAALSGARAQEIEQARARAENAKRNLERLKALQKDEMVSQDQVESAQLQYDIYRAQLSLLEEGTRPEDIEALNAQVESAKTALESAKDNMLLIDIKKANLEAAKAQLESAQAAFEQAATAKEASIWEKELAQAEASVKRAQAALDLARQRLDESTIRSPITGTIAQRFLDKGDMANINRPFMTVVDMDVMKVNAKVSERDISKIKVGQKALVKPDAYPGQIFEGVVTKISPIIDRSSQTCEIEIEVPNREQKLKSGMFARIDIKVSEGRLAPVIPSDVVLKEGNETFVFVIENGKAVKKPILIGANDGIRTEVLSGVRAGDRIIVSGYTTLKDGMNVSLLTKKGEQKERGHSKKEVKR